MFMLVVTTAMFALGLIALVLDTTLAYQQIAVGLGSASGSSGGSKPWSARLVNVATAIGAIIVCAIVSVQPPTPPPLCCLRCVALYA
jgi:hypothetical protein